MPHSLSLSVGHGYGLLCDDTRMASAWVRDLKALLDQLAGSSGRDDRTIAENQALRSEAIGRFIADGARQV